MYLKEFKISNFRKFRNTNNKISFVDARSLKQEEDGKEINIASTTTLIVGKNNSGKTTITKALDKIINGEKFSANDFNYQYLSNLVEDYNEFPNKYTPPYLEFEVTIGTDDNDDDLVTNVIPLMSLQDIENSELNVIIRYEVREQSIFEEKVKNYIEKSKESLASNPESKTKQKDVSLIDIYNLLDIVDSTEFKVNYYKEAGEEIPDFKLNKLIEIKSISANNIKSDDCLSKAFNTIVAYRHSNSLSQEERDKIEDDIRGLNSSLTTSVAEKYSGNINESLGKIETKDRLSVNLRSNLSVDTLFSKMIKYEYIEGNHTIPEDQFGLGYTNLMMIIAELIDYIEKYPNHVSNSKINLISIEEPETFMHPQMQELFIKNINDAINALLKNSDKNVNSQLVLTTHSSHILNSKIHTGNSFNNINYITALDGYSNVVNLNDEKLTPQNAVEKNIPSIEGKNPIEQLKFLKKHIKYKVSEMFFSDAVIFVEGITEETLLRYYIDINEKLNRYYISMFRIDGAHGLVYHNLIKQLKVPCLIITDLDIKRNDEEKGEKIKDGEDGKPVKVGGYTQVTSLDKRKTTNATIKKYNKSNDLSKVEDCYKDKNIFVTFQNKIEGFFPTSFEEAFILTNHNNEVLIKGLKTTIPNTYKNIVGDNEDKNNLKTNSFKLQRKLSGSKSDFANNMLYAIIEKDDSEDVPILPGYIEVGFNWLADQIKKEVLS